MLRSLHFCLLFGSAGQEFMYCSLNRKNWSRSDSLGRVKTQLAGPVLHGMQGITVRREMTVQYSSTLSLSFAGYMQHGHGREKVVSKATAAESVTSQTRVMT